MFAKRFDPAAHDAIMEAARRKGIVCKRTHEVITPEQAIHLVSEQLGVAILTKACSVGLRHEGVVVKSFSETSLRLEACLIMRADDDSRLVNEFARSFLRKYAPSGRHQSKWNCHYQPESRGRKAAPGHTSKSKRSKLALARERTRRTINPQRHRNPRAALVARRPSPLAARLYTAISC
jgi:hypothetical protein